MKIRLVLFFMLLSITYATSQTCCSGGVPLSNNIGLPILEKGTWQIGMFYDYNNLNTLNDGRESLNDDSRLRITHSVLVNLGYSISDNLSVEGLFTWVNQRRNITQFGNSNLDQTSGIGDAIVLGRYRIVNKSDYEISVGAGAKLPIGSTTNKNDAGITLNADLQPGSNALDIIYITSFSKRFSFRQSMNFSTRLTYRSTGTNNEYLGSSKYKFGNEFQAFLSVSDQFLLFKQIVVPSISFKFRDVKRDMIDGNEITSTGGNWVFLIPDFSINLTPQILFTTRLEVPLYANVRGTQLTPTYRISTGVSIQLSKKRGLQINNTI
ncbi:hypothetical protein RQM59_08885 [Flavobacteriaceae bacterium S356]|uniref:Transporter n=1 Tax=Asprobacillus argus TaxID=3076534 RepID=A0ABU3LH76_9FLAO|nr:hypothetical protein [Flavobacteriaceae bacterium S356]